MRKEKGVADSRDRQAVKSQYNAMLDSEHTCDAGKRASHDMRKGSR